MAVTHKLKLGAFAPCGQDYFANKRQVLTSYRWKTVTCRRCLATRKPVKVIASTLCPSPEAPIPLSGSEG